MTSTDLELFKKSELIRKFAVELVEENSDQNFENTTPTCQSYLKDLYFKYKLRKDVINDAVKFLNEMFILLPLNELKDPSSNSSPTSPSIASLLLSIDKNYKNQNLINFNFLTFQNFFTEKFEISFKELNDSVELIDLFLKAVKENRLNEKSKICFKSKIADRICFLSNFCNVL